MQNLIIYKITSLYHILKELDLDLNFNISFIDNKNSLNHELNNQIVIENSPINIFKLIEKKIKHEKLKRKDNKYDFLAHESENSHCL